MLSFQFTQRISEILYKWILDSGEGDPRGSMYTAIFSNSGPKAGHGMEYCLWFLLLVSVATAAIYYFVVASNILNASKKNYITTYIMGYISLVAVNYVGLQVLVDANVLGSMNVLMVCLIDIVYYTLFFEVFSYCFKPLSKDSNTELYSAIFK